MGGIYNTINASLYHYAGNNPVKYSDPAGLYTENEIEDFKKSSAEEQMIFLKSEFQSVQESSNTTRGIKASEMRGLRSSMKLKDLFEQDESFMNENLRDFLNLKEDGTMNYKREELTSKNGWKELCSIGSQYHQSKAGDKNNLNAKFVNNKDGREVVIGKDGIICNTYPDKGTFNYANGNPVSSILWGKHKLFDMNPYDTLMSKSGIETVKKYNGVFAGGLWFGNSHYWK